MSLMTPPIPDLLSPNVIKAVAEAVRDMAEASSMIAPDAAPPAQAPTRARKVLGFVVEKLSQPSTIRGLLMLATSLGLVISPVAQEYVIEIGLAVVGLVGVVANK